jgi:hypothetical protein
VQITDYLYAIRRRLWVPIAVPLAAAVVTAGVLYIQPEKYQANGTVVVPALSARGYSTSAVTQYVSTFKDVLVSTPVVRQVAIDTGESQSDLVAGLAATTTTASSNIIIVTYTGPNKKNVDAVVRYAAINAMDTLLYPQLAGATLAVATSGKALDTVNANLNDFATTTGVLFPDEDYRVKSQELSQLIVQLTEAKLARDSARVAGLQTIVDQYKAELVQLATLVGQYQILVQQRSAAEAVYNKAHEDLGNVNAQISSDHDPRTVTVKNLGHVSRLPDILKFGAVAFGVALLLSLAFIIFMEFFGPSVALVPYLRRLANPAPSTLRPAAAQAGGPAELAGTTDAAGVMVTRTRPRRPSRRVVVDQVAAGLSPVAAGPAVQAQPAAPAGYEVAVPVEPPPSAGDAAAAPEMVAAAGSGSNGEL